MKGTRRADGTAPWELEPGDYCLRGGVVWVNLPNGNGPAQLRGWQHEIHPDDSITVSPSILAHKTADAGEWHGWLEHGVWRQA